MSTRRKVGPKIKPTSKRTVQDFEKAVRRHEVAGSFPPDQREVIEEQYFNARFSLYELIQQLEAQPDSTVKTAWVPLSGDSNA
jgi:hypothetical protein